MYKNYNKNKHYSKKLNLHHASNNKIETIINIKYHKPTLPAADNLKDDILSKLNFSNNIYGPLKDIECKRLLTENICHQN